MSKRFFLVLAVLSVRAAALGWADSTTVIGSSVPETAVPIVSTGSALTLADEGETISSPTPHAMTDSSDNASFVTLTKAQFPAGRLPANADIVFPEEARRFDALNAGQALFHEAGILFQAQGSPNYPLAPSIRGAPANQTLVLMDGRPVKGASLGSADLSEIPLQQIDHLEIVRGGQSALYGPNAMAGVINVITKRAVYRGFPQSHISYEGASFSRQTYKLDFGSRQGPLDYFFFGDQQWESGFRSNSDNSQYNIGGNAGLSMGKGGKLLFDAGSYHNNSGVPGFRCGDTLDPLTCASDSGPLAPNRFNNKDEKPAGTPYARQVTDSNFVRASYLIGLPKDMYLAARLFGHQREVDLDDSSDPIVGNAAFTDRREHSKGGDLQLNLPLGLLAGGSFTHDDEDYLDRLTTSNSFSAWTENWGLFAQETMTWKALTLIPSGRYDESTQFGHTANPQVQAILETTDWLRLSGSGGRSFRSPTLDETHLNPELLPEKSWTYEAGFELHESSRSLRANVFRADVGDAIQSSTFSAVNLGTARRQGVEVQLALVQNEYIRENLNYTYLENRGIPAGGDHLVDLSYSPRHIANIMVVITPSRKWEIDPTFRYEDARYSGNDHSGTKMGSQLIMDLRLAYQWRQMELFFGIKDVGDKRYVEVPGYPLAGRTAYFGIRLRLWG